MTSTERRPLPIHEVPETVAQFGRQLADGQTLEYRLQVLQQPQRARACGQGAKSHADRRPVDPPPVVELRLFQGTGDNKQDVTFSHASNFFLYATLELARPIAQGRGMAPAPASSPPVLTGVPVSGMAYLDRPAPAGYFIFPDLSVRHEGSYRLRFSLYEEPKEPVFTQPEDPHEPREFCSHRLDVKSEAFQVYSAKKFPGLAESTALSRYMAEQGCRVRIRRDVRMRRRSDRHGRECSEELDETAILRAARDQSCDQYDVENHIQQQQASQQPQQPHHQQHRPTASPYPQSPAPYMERAGSVDRKRSSSDVSVSSMPESRHQPYNNGYSTPVQNHGPYGPPAAAPPPPPSYASQQSQHLTFGSYNAGISAPPPPSVHGSQQQQQMYQPQKRAQYTPTHSTPYQAPPVPPMAQQPRRGSMEDYQRRRESVSSYQAPPPPSYRPITPSHPAPYSAPQTHNYHHQYQQPQQQPQYHQMHTPAPAPAPTPAPSNNSLPPLRLPALEPKLWNNQPSTPSATPTPSTPSAYGPPEHQRPAPAPAPPASNIPQPSPSQFPNYYPDANNYAAKYSAQQQQAHQTDSAGAGKKRPWGRVFNTAHTEGPLVQGARPDDGEVYGADPYTSEIDDSADDYASEVAKVKMSYRRADGIEIIRKLPGYAPS